MRKCEKMLKLVGGKGQKKAQTCNSVNMSVGFQNRVRIWRSIDSEKVCGGSKKHRMFVYCQLHR